MDNIENYSVRIDGYKRYKCECCDYIAKQKKDMADHLLSKKHKLTTETKPKSIPIPVNKEENINMIINTPPKNSPPKSQLKGKTYLSTYCAETIKLDASLPYMERYARRVVFDQEDLDCFAIKTPNQFLLYMFMKLIKKEGGLDKFFFRCVDTSRKRFYYHDHNVGWTEDMLDLEIIKFIRDLIANYLQNFVNGGKSRAREEIMARAMLYTFWGREYESIEDCRNKGKKKADQEISECLDFLSRLLEIKDCD